VAQAQKNNLVELGRRTYAQLPGSYHDHDIFVFPSVSETFGHPMVEAMSSGIPVLAADTAVNREICGSAALYFSPFSASSLAECVRRLDNNPSLRLQLVSEGRRRTVEKFTWDSYVDRLVALLHQVGEGGPVKLG
jgi:glycosyltransferase involved in cell wall biosynthesis